jgi:hypothetical protein
MAKCWPLAIVLCGITAVANAATMAELRYQAPTHRHCPTQSELETAVSARLGYVPFTPDADSNVVAVITASGKKLSGRVELRDRSGALHGTRTLEGSDCEDLAQSLALAITLAIDPLVMQRAPAPASVPVVAPPPPQPTLPPPLSAPVPTPRPLVRLGVAVLASIAAAPDVEPGFEIEAGLGWHYFSLALAGHVDAPDSTPLIQTQLLYGALTPCFHYSVGMFCGRVIAGALRGAGTQIANPREDTTFYAAAGARAGVEVRVYRAFFLSAFVDVNTVLTRTRIDVNASPAWTTPVLNGDIGVKALVIL